MSEITRYVDERLNNSITSNTPVSDPIDRNAPLTFTEWLQYNNFLYSNTEDFLSRYQSYLNNWFAVTNTTVEDSQQIIKQYYLTLINEIVLNYTTVDERRYLKNLDYNNNRDLTLAIPFFAKKIKDICLYYCSLRETVTTAVTQYNLKGSNYGIQQTLYNLFVNALGTDDLTADITTLQLSLSSIRNNTTFEIEDIYDIYTDYYDINPLAPASAYNSNSDLRSQYFTLNQYTVDPDLFINISFSILRAILSYPFYLIELGDGLTVTPAVNVTQTNLLKDSDYTDLVAVSSIAALNLSIKAQEIQKYIGTDLYYLQTNSTGNYVVSGVLCKAESDFANFLNKRFPSVAAVPSEEYLRTEKELGKFFKPDKLGISTFTNFKFTPSINDTELEPNTLYYFPDPYKYGNVTSNTGLTFKTPFEFVEDSTFNKVDFSNSYEFGDSITDPFFQTFRAYQAREQSLDKANFGLSRYVDSQEFFTGNEKTIWSNPDVYPLVPSNVFPIDERAKKLLTTNKTLVQYKNDIYGNEFGLYKEIEPSKGNSFNNINALNANNFSVCLALNGKTFYDVVSGYNFDYTEVNIDRNYSGVILKTVTNPNSFVLTAAPLNIFSYPLQPEIFCSDFSTVDYDCSVIDALEFTLPDGTPYPLTPVTDSAQFNPNDGRIYYSILIDAGMGIPTDPAFALKPNKTLADYRATFANPGDFTFSPRNSSIPVYDSFRFLVNGRETCTSLTNTLPSYVEASNFVDIHIFGRETIVDETSSALTTKKTIYRTNNSTYGDLFYRNSSSSLIVPASAALSGVYIKYNNAIQTELQNNILDFDVYYDTIQFETENYTVFDKITFDYTTNTVIGGGPGVNIIERGSNKALEKISTVWFNEQDKHLLVCKTVLFHELSASNYKIVYPKIYSFDLNTLQLVQLYPTIRDENLTFKYLSEFSLSGKNIELNIVEIDKPLLTYNIETNIYKLTYMGRDIADIFYIFNIYFKYINGTLSLYETTMFKVGSDVYDQNFSNPDTIENKQYFETYTVLNTSVGSIDPNTNWFVWS